VRSILLRRLLPVFLLNPAAARSAEVVISNDASVGGIPSTVANFFIAGERAASTLTSSCTGDVVAAQVYWVSQFGSAPDTGIAEPRWRQRADQWARVERRCDE